MDQVWEDKPANYAKASAMLDMASPMPGSMVVLPEMFPTGYSNNLAVTAKDEPFLTDTFLGNLAKNYKCWILSGSVRGETKEMGENIAVTFNPEGKRISSFTKLHPVKYYGEDKSYAPGTAVQTFKCNDFSVSPFICYDLRFPEVFRIAAFQGATLIVVIANWPAIRIDHWEILLRARAIENQAFVVGVNRCGKDPNLEYPGRSLILDQQGRFLAEANDSECVISADLDLNALNDWRDHFPALDDARLQFLPNNLLNPETTFDL